MLCQLSRISRSEAEKEQEAHDWRTVRSEARLIAVQNAATADDPGGMLTATAKRPSPGHAIAAGDDCGISEGPKRPGCPDSPVIAVDFTSRLGRQIPAERATFAADCHTPACGTVSSGDLFDDTDKGHWVSFFTAERTRNPQAKQAGLRYRLDQRKWQPARLLDFFCT